VNQVGGNFIGTNVTGTKALKNGKDGVAIFDGATFNSVGLDAPIMAGAHSTLGSLNLISGNGGDGVAIYRLASRNVVDANLIGTNAPGTLALGNKGDGVFVYLGDDLFATVPDGNFVGAPPVTVFGVSLPAGPNVISGNGGNGVELTGKAVAGAIVPPGVTVL